MTNGVIADPYVALLALQFQIQAATGCDMWDHAKDFQPSKTEPCNRCRTVTATAMLADDYDGVARRLCQGCCAW